MNIEKILKASQQRPLTEEEREVIRTLRKGYREALREKKALRRHNRQLNAEGLLDGLTQVYNRKSFDKILDRAMEALDKGDIHGFGMLCSDIDNLKAVNEKYGHAKGDEAIKYTARFLSGFFRTPAVEDYLQMFHPQRLHDFLCRIGGDEFFAIAANHDYCFLLRRAKDIHDKSCEDRYVNTLSMGVSWVCAPMDTREFYDGSDKALMKAKRHNRRHDYREGERRVGLWLPDENKDVMLMGFDGNVYGDKGHLVGHFDSPKNRLIYDR